jgi:CheY-like chemotaxis protein
MARGVASSTRENHVGQRSPTRILLVEDNVDSAALLAEVLELHGYQVEIAHSVEQALALHHQAELLVCDIALPDGNGLDVIRALRQRSAIRGVALSGYGTTEDIQRSTDAGFETHLVKPVDPARLLEVLQQMRNQR